MKSTGELARLNFLLELLTASARVTKVGELFQVLERYLKWCMPFKSVAIALQGKGIASECVKVDSGGGFTETSTPSLPQEWTEIIHRVILIQTPATCSVSPGSDLLCVPLNQEEEPLGALLFSLEGARFKFEDLKVANFIGEYLSVKFSRIYSIEIIDRQKIEIEKSHLQKIISNEREISRVKIEEALAKEKMAVKYRDEFLAIVSHELKNPLATLLLLLQLTDRAIEPDENKTPPPEKLKNTVHLCLRQIEKIEILLNDLLDISRIQVGRLAYNYSPLELAKLIERTIEAFSVQAASANCKIELKLCKPIYVQADAFRIEQVVSNIVNNALKYAPGKPILISLEAHSGLAQVKVQDHGPGIPQNKLTTIFELFERAASGPQVAGFGLGLYISRQIMVAHHGSLTVESTENVGSTFTFTLPLCQVNE